MSIRTPSEDMQGFEIRPFLVEFRNPKVEADFLRHHLPKTQSQLRQALIFCSFFYVAFALTDVAVLGYGKQALTLFLFRLSVAATALLSIFMVFRHPKSLTVPAVAATIVEIAGMATFMLIVVYRFAEMPWHGMSISIMLIVVYLFIPNRLINAMAVTIASTLVFLYLAFEAGNLTASDKITLSMLLLLLNTFGAVSARRYHRLWREEFRAQSNLKNLSTRDYLTGCYNRRHLHEHLLDAEILRAQRYGLWLTVILCDLDHFKRINDGYGHDVGDTVLRTFSGLLKSMTRERIDCVVRYGGEEFLLVVPETDLTSAAALAESLRIAWAQYPIADAAEEKIHTTACFGVIAVNFAASEQSITQSAMITAADGLLYEAKKAGRNCTRSNELQPEMTLDDSDCCCQAAA
jgi:diguanylate cyclase (GGDEF)-like protein